MATGDPSVHYPTRPLSLAVSLSLLLSRSLSPSLSIFPSSSVPLLPVPLYSPSLSAPVGPLIVYLRPSSILKHAPPFVLSFCLFFATYTRVDLPLSLSLLSLAHWLLKKTTWHDQVKFVNPICRAAIGSVSRRDRDQTSLITVIEILARLRFIASLRSRCYLAIYLFSHSFNLPTVIYVTA